MKTAFKFYFHCVKMGLSERKLVRTEGKDA